jgi:hypothetical protein
MRIASSATTAASVIVQRSGAGPIGTSVTTIVPRPTSIDRRRRRNAAAKNSGTEASPTPSGSPPPTRIRTAA